ncbi:MAG: hypothetical protein AABN95_09580 [Acidobacteriota bacterium]
MTLEEIEQSLPNGLHDAYITNIRLDYVKREARFDLEVSWDDPEKEEPESYRAATLSLSPFLYFIIEPPDSKYPFAHKEALWIDAGSDKLNSVSTTQLPKPLPEGAFAYWFFVNNWNSFIHVAALDASIVLH